MADLRDLLGVNVDVVTPGGLRYIRERVMAEARPLEGRPISMTSSSLFSEAISRQNKDMAKPIIKPVDQKNGHSPKTPITPLGKELRKLREKYIASGGKLLNRRELEREVAERRGSR